MKYSTREEFEKADAFGIGAPNDAYAQYFVGESFLKSVTEDGAPVPIHNVTFEPGCRNNWHIHKATSGGGQILICTAGEGWYQEWGKEPVKLTEGTVIEIPANTKHWHGAAKDSWFSHLTFEPVGEDKENVWLEPVESDLYD